jgi:uncharacterized membrane protein
MGVKDWPRPLKRAIAWSLVLFAAAILIASTWALVAPLASGRFFNFEERAWANLLVHYSMIITAPLGIICSLVAFRHFIEKGDRRFVFFLVMGVAIGLGIGLLLIPLTGGFSLISTPPFTGFTMITAWLIRRPDRDVPNTDGAER